MIETSAPAVTSRTTPDSRPAPRQDAPSRSDNAERFAKALARQDDRKGKGKSQSAANGTVSDAPPLPTQAQPASVTGQERQPSRRDEKKEPQGAAAASADAATARHLPDAAPPPPSPPPGMDTATQFAERLALQQNTGAQSHVQLDERLYAVSNLVIGSGSDGGLAISYETSADAQDQDASRDDDLRRRLEARGLKVGTIVRS